MRRATQAAIDAYSLREARKASHMTQVELAQAMGVSQNRVSHMENGGIGAMSLDTIRRYIEAVGGKVSLVADLPTGQVSLAPNKTSKIESLEISKPRDWQRNLFLQSWSK